MGQLGSDILRVQLEFRFQAFGHLRASIRRTIFSTLGSTSAMARVSEETPQTVCQPSLGSWVPAAHISHMMQVRKNSSVLQAGRQS